MNTYEALIIFPESIKEDELESRLKPVLAEFENLGGRTVHSTRMGRKQFARTMQKQTSGHYVLVTFELEGTKIPDLLKRYKTNDDVFRVQIVTANQSNATTTAEATTAEAEV